MNKSDIITADELDSIVLFAYSVSFKIFIGLFAFHAALVTGALPYALSIDPNYACGSRHVVKSSAMVMIFVTVMFVITHLFVHDTYLMMWGRYKVAALKDGRFKLLQRKLTLVSVLVLSFFAIIGAELRFAWRVNHFHCQVVTGAFTAAAPSPSA